MTPLGADGWPDLVDPVLVAAFEGWNDAGDAASGALEHLQLVWDAQPLAELDPDDYYDFQVNRPSVSLSDGLSRRIDWPTTRLSVCRPPGAEFDLVLMHGIEPNMRWRAFCAELLEAINAIQRPGGGHPRRAAVRHAAHPAHQRHRHRLRPRLRGAVRAGALQVRGSDRHRGGAAGRLRLGRDPRRLVLGRRAPLRFAAPQSRRRPSPSCAG